jgi:hypothetical protein
MRFRTDFIAAMVGFVVLLPWAALAAIEVLKEEPPKDSLPRGKVVYVDDGTCPSGETRGSSAGCGASSAPTE